MGKRVVVVASGATELAALPHLLRHLESEGTRVMEVRIPPKHQALDPVQAAKLISAAWYSRAEDDQPDKFVVLVDADAKDPEQVLAPFAKIAQSIRLPVPILTAAAKLHLEAWFFADPQTLRSFVGGSLGSVESQPPDEVENPKLCLKNLLREFYVARDAGEIAMKIRPSEARRSPSFTRFEAAVRNGGQGT